MRSTSFSCQILMQLDFSRHIFEKSANIKFHKHFFRASWALPCGHTDRQTDGQTDMTNLNVVFRNVQTGLKRQ